MQWWWWWLFITHEPVKCLLSYWINQHYRRCYIQSDYFQTWVTSGKSCCWETMSVRKSLFKPKPVTFFIHGKILPPTYIYHCDQAQTIMTIKVIVNTKMKAAGWKIIITMIASGEEAAELGDADSGLMWKPHNIEVTVNIIINIKKQQHWGDRHHHHQHKKTRLRRPASN